MQSTAMNEVDDAFDRSARADAAVEQARNVLSHAEHSGDIEKVRSANTHLEATLAVQEAADYSLRVLRGDFLEEELARQKKVGIDLSKLATPDKLIEVFGEYTGMDASWFKRVDDTPGLSKAKVIKGEARKGATRQPYFCPFKVCNWLADPKRKKGEKISQETAWRLLQRHFPAVYDEYQSYDPR